MLALVTDAFGGEGGIAQVTRDLVTALAGIDDIDFVDILPRAASREPGGVPANGYQHPPRPGRLTYTAAAVEIARRRPDLIYCNHLFMGPLAAALKFATGARLIVHLHGIEAWREPTALRRRALESSDLILCASRFTRARALAYADVPPDRAVVLNNAVRARFSPGDRDDARRRFGWGESDFVLLTVGRLNARERYKGHDRIIPLLRTASSSFGSRRLVYAIAGGGEDRERLESLAREAGVADSVLFLGEVDDTSMPYLYRAADWFVMPSTGEGFGIVYIEAMACGTPALGLAFGGATDALADGALGQCVPPSELDSTLRRLASLPRPDPISLSAAVHARFGLSAFDSRLRQALAMLDEGSPSGRAQARRASTANTVLPAARHWRTS